MTTDERERRRNAAPIAIVLIVLLVVLPCVYVLSIGPAVYLVNHGHPEWADTADTIYRPILWLSDNCGPIRVVVHAYMSFWSSLGSG
jgi:hypothetical protein